MSCLQDRTVARSEASGVNTSNREGNGKPSRAVSRFAVTCAFVGAASLPRAAVARHGELPNRVPEAAPYNVDEAREHPPPYDKYFSGPGNPRVCGQCHQRIFQEWNGSMMSNSWRDPAWRAAFFLLARLTATDGNCDVPDPPDGTKRARLNPFANPDCSSTFDIGQGAITTKGSGSLLDAFCSRCHMPANYIDAVKPSHVKRDKESGLEHGLVDSDFDPTSAGETPFAFATVEGRSKNTEAGKLGLTCSFCHTIAETRETPFHNYRASSTKYSAAVGRGTRATLLAPEFAEILETPSDDSRTLGYAVGAGAYRISPQALLGPERFGPLTHSRSALSRDPYVSSAFATDVPYQSSDFQGSIHKGNYHVLFERAELCATCHDVTNPMTVKNRLGRWVGGFPIERTYSEWASSRYADRPGNKAFDPAHKRDCQTCHMQQDYGKPGTAQTLFDDSGPVRALSGKPALTSPERPVYYSHHFIGGNTYSTRLIGADTSSNGKTEPYPELSKYSFSSSDPDSPYHSAYFENVSDRGPATQHARLAWDRLRKAVTVDLDVPDRTKDDHAFRVHVRVTNTGAGHDFPTGFPEGRNAWVALRAFDLATGNELQIADSVWKRRSLGVGYLTSRDSIDPNFPNCRWEVPAGAPDPYAVQFRAVASLGDGCPTLELPYATPLNLVVNSRGLPIDERGRVIDRDNPRALPRFGDMDGDGDLYDDAFLVDTRLRPLPNRGSSVNIDRYSIVVPDGVVGPVSVTAAVYYQSMEAVAAKKLLGNLADTDGDHVLEPCVLRGPCDGRTPSVEPAVVEGAAPVPISVRSAVVRVGDHADVTPPDLAVYPTQFETNVYRDVVPKVTASEPVRGIDASSFRLLDASGTAMPAEVAQIDDTTWALFPDQVFLRAGQSYRLRLSGIVCDLYDNCANQDASWSFTIADERAKGAADTRPPRIRRPEAPPIEGQASVLSQSAWQAIATSGAVLVLLVLLWIRGSSFGARGGGGHSVRWGGVR